MRTSLISNNSSIYSRRNGDLNILNFLKLQFQFLMIIYVFFIIDIPSQSNIS